MGISVQLLLEVELRPQTGLTSGEGAAAAAAGEVLLAAAAAHLICLLLACHGPWNGSAIASLLPNYCPNNGRWAVEIELTAH